MQLNSSLMNKLHEDPKLPYDHKQAPPSISMDQLDLSSKLRSISYYPSAPINYNDHLVPIQLTFNWNGCALTNDKSINWHKGILKIDSILTIECSHISITTYPNHRGVDLQLASLIGDSKQMNRQKLEFINVSGLRAYCQGIMRADLKVKTVFIRCFSWSFNTSNVPV